MEGTVDDFLNEINELVPLQNRKKDEPAADWQECFDEQSGFHYYWNTKTNDVTWSKPDRYLPMKKSGKVAKIPTDIKIYKISDAVLPPSKPIKREPPKVNVAPKKITSKFKKPSSDSEDEKIVLISSYGGDTESESEEDSTIKDNKTCIKPPPIEVKKSGTFSLVAGYSDSEEENEEIKSVFPIQPPPVENKISHSTLFPITKPIDVKDFLDPPPEEKQEESSKPTNEFDSKAFQRKRRIGIALVNTGKKMKEEAQEGESERKGFGFSGETTTYAGFQKGGVLFVKPETSEEPVKEEVTKVNQKELEDTYGTLKEKLGFLSEGRPEVSPVQVMIIQAETLFTAMKDDGLKPIYLNKWLSETCADLIKLEKEATPDGWTLKWDRSHKRYYYQNQATGEGQWEYPQPDVLRRDEAMDISTTPPPVGSESTMHMSPPLPPVIRSPTPPPPPIISATSELDEAVLPDVPLPPETKDDKCLSINQPLPPGVDVPEVENDSLNTALDSFYSDIARIDNSNSPPAVSEDVKTEDLEQGKKKKKTKVKLTQGLAMKKKGVSKLVEKWKNVQMTYDT